MHRYKIVIAPIVLVFGWMLGPLVGRLAPNFMNINYMTYMISIFAVIYLSSKLTPGLKELCLSLLALTLLYWIIPKFIIVPGHDIDLSQFLDRQYMFRGFMIIVLFAHSFDYVVRLLGGLFSHKEPVPADFCEKP